MSSTDDAREVRAVSPRKEKWDAGATVFGGLLVLVFLVVEGVRFARADGVPTEAGRVAGPAATDSGAGVDPAVLEPVTTGFLWAAVVANMVFLTVVAVLVAVVAARCLRGRFFDAITIRLLWAISWVILAGILFLPILGTLGTNLALRDLDATGADVRVWDPWWFLGMYLFLMMVSLMAVAFRRAAIMRQDQDGLI